MSWIDAGPRLTGVVRCDPVVRGPNVAPMWPRQLVRRRWSPISRRVPATAPARREDRDTNCYEDDEGRPEQLGARHDVLPFMTMQRWLQAKDSRSSVSILSNLARGAHAMSGVEDREVPSLEGAFRQSVHVGSCSSAAGQTLLPSSVVDRGNRQASMLRARGGHGRRERSWLRRGSDGYKLNRRVRPVQDDHLPRWQAP
jgi:hypothetical protein